MLSAAFSAEYQPKISSAEYRPKQNSASRISAEKKCQPEFGYEKIRLRGLITRDLSWDTQLFSDD